MTIQLFNGVFQSTVLCKIQYSESGKSIKVIFFIILDKLISYVAQAVDQDAVEKKL